MRRWGGLQRIEGRMYWYGPNGLEPIVRCACPDGCSTGWGWKHGLCGACHANWIERRDAGEASADLGEYRIDVDGEPFVYDVWRGELSPAGRRFAKRMLRGEVAWDDRFRRTGVRGSDLGL